MDITLEEAMELKEKKYLMEKYVSILLLQLELDDADSGNDQKLDDETVESLLVARVHVSCDLSRQIAALLSSKGHELEEDGEEEVEETDPPEMDPGDELFGEEEREASGDEADGEAGE